MRVFVWAAINTLYLGCIYAGFVGGIDGAFNVAIAWGWFASVVGMLCLLCGDDIKRDSKKTPRVIAALDPIVDGTAAFAFLWFGHTALGIAVLIAIAGFSSARK